MGPKVPDPIYTPDSISSSDYLIFSFCQLPSASVGILGLPWEVGNFLHIFADGSQTAMYKRGRPGAKVPRPKNNLKF